MKKLVIVAALGATLAGCGNPAEESDEPVPAATTTAAAAPESSAGTYEVTASGGTRFTAALAADGSYRNTTADGAVIETGSWADRDGRTCLDPAGEDTAEVCFAIGDQAADGTMVATPDNGSDTLTVRKTG